MATARVHLRELLQDSQDLGSDDEHMVSRVLFDLEVSGQTYPGLHADIKQPVGSSYEDAAIEVSRPVGYDGPFNFDAFRGIVEAYYRGLVGASGSVMRLVGGSGTIRMRNNRIIRQQTAEFEVGPPRASW